MQLMKMSQNQKQNYAAHCQVQMEEMLNSIHTGLIRHVIVR